jgi:hypothetical protein
MQPFRCHLLEQHISKRNYESTVVQEIHISELEPQKGPLKLIFPFLSIYLGLRYEKLKSFSETFTTYNQILIFDEQLLYVCPKWNFIFDTDQADIYSAGLLTGGGGGGECKHNGLACKKLCG